MSNLSLEEKLTDIRNRMDRACKKSDRNPNDVKLLLATKTVSAENINHTLALGETLIGESKVQELTEKFPLIRTEQAESHFIGHLQTNKVKKVIDYVTCIHSVDRLKLGNRLHRLLTESGNKLDILVQVNTSYEESKFGVAPDDALHLIKQLAKLDTLNIKGLMTIGKFSADPDEARKCFRLLKSIQEEVQAENIPRVEMDVLSMGMSGDLEIAIEEGSTMIRVGTAIFGERMYPDSYYWNEQKQVIDE